MNRKIFELKTVEQPIILQPSDEWFKANRGRKPWGLVKRNWITSQMTCTPEYQRGLGQGRVDMANGLEYSEERSASAYNLGYYKGYTEYVSNRRGWHPKVIKEFDEKYLREVI